MNTLTCCGNNYGALGQSVHSAGENEIWITCCSKPWPFLGKEKGACVKQGKTEKGADIEGPPGGKVTRDSGCAKSQEPGAENDLWTSNCTKKAKACSEHKEWQCKR